MDLNKRAERLSAFVDSAGPVVWGESDCCPFTAKWIKQETGKTIPLPRYGSAEEAKAIIAKAGGLLNLVMPRMDRAGFVETREPQLGDVGVIALRDKDIGIIFATNGLAIARCELQGMAFIMPRKIVRAWSI